MRYAFRVTWDTRTKVPDIHPIMPVRDNVRGYKLHYTGNHTGESLRVFDTIGEAQESRDLELQAAEFARKSSEELLQILIDDRETLNKYGVTLRAICAVSGVGYESALGFIYRGVKPSYRAVFQLHRGATGFLQFISRAQGVSLEKLYGGKHI